MKMQTLTLTDLVNEEPRLRMLNHRLPSLQRSVNVVHLITALTAHPVGDPGPPGVLWILPTFSELMHMEFDAWILQLAQSRLELRQLRHHLLRFPARHARIILAINNKQRSTHRSTGWIGEISRKKSWSCSRSRIRLPAGVAGRGWSVLKLSPGLRCPRYPLPPQIRRESWSALRAPGILQKIRPLRRCAGRSAPFGVSIATASAGRSPLLPTANALIGKVGCSCQWVLDPRVP